MADRRENIIADLECRTTTWNGKAGILSTARANLNVSSPGHTISGLLPFKPQTHTD